MIFLCTDIFFVIILILFFKYILSKYSYYSRSAEYFDTTIPRQQFAQALIKVTPFLLLTNIIILNILFIDNG